MTKQIKITMLTAFLAAFVMVAGTGCKSQKKMKDIEEDEETVAREEPETTEVEEKETVAEVEEESTVKETDKEEDISVKLENYFDAIASANSEESAKRSSEEVLGLFASGDTPVLIIIYQSGSEKDYDEPTTISKYLDYLRITKNNINRVHHVEYNDDGKISMLELKKKL